jgi:hypothetical protein
MGKTKQLQWGTVATRCCNRTAHAFQMAFRFYGKKIVANKPWVESKNKLRGKVRID